MMEHSVNAANAPIPDISAANRAHDTRRILEQRAARLARPRRGIDEEERISIVEFCVRGEQYGIEPTYVREVYRFNTLTRVPGAPAFVVGIINVRGRVVSLIDLRVFFELPLQGLHDRSRALILASGDMEFGVLIDAIDRTRDVPVADMETSLPSLTGIRKRYLKGITSDRVVILDGGRLLSDNTLIAKD